MDDYYDFHRQILLKLSALHSMARAEKVHGKEEPIELVLRSRLLQNFMANAPESLQSLTVITMSQAEVAHTTVNIKS